MLPLQLSLFVLCLTVCW